MPKVGPGDVLVDPEDRHFLDNFKWYKRNDGYIVRSVHIGWVEGRHRYKRVYLHRVIMRAADNEVVDHINGDRSDNRHTNLRLVTQHVNMQSASVKLNANNTSGYRGVFWNKRVCKWQARAKVNGKQYLIGYFTTPEAANEAAHLWRLANMPGYAPDPAPSAIAEYKLQASARPKRPPKAYPPAMCACGCGRVVRDARSRFAHGGLPKHAHGVLPSGAHIDDLDRHLLVGRSWHITSTGYVAARIDNKITLLHRLITGAAPGFVVDHINGNPIDNRRSNLRVVSFRENQQNLRLSAQNSSGFRGVTFDKARSKWVAQAKMNGKRVFIGRFGSIEEAAEATHKWRLKHMPGYLRRGDDHGQQPV